MSIVDQLHVRVSAVCPITGVTIVDPANKLTWVIHFHPAATNEQRTAAQGIVTAFDAAAVDVQIATRSARIAADQQEAGETRVDAAVLALLDMTTAQRLQWARNNFPTLTLAEQNRIGMLMTMVAVSMRPQVR